MVCFMVIIRSSLSLNGCSRITDESMIEVASYCANLQYLDLSRTLVGPRGVYALEKSFLKDKILNDESIRKSSGSRGSSGSIVFRTYLKGLYLDYTR
jgi:hypothetical protein